jgi:hypothetical protein
VRLTFLLDENILYHAIRGVNEQNNPDTTAADLLDGIGTICHVIFVHPWLIERYQRALKKLRQDPPLSDEANNFLRQLLYNNLKRTCEYGAQPDLPADINVPAEDVDLVRAALITHPIIVSADAELREAIQSQPALGLRVLDARGALDLARAEVP